MFMDMFAACYYHCDRVLHLSGDVGTNPGPHNFCPACNTCIHIRRVLCECGYSFNGSCAKKALEIHEHHALKRESNCASQRKKRALESVEASTIRRESDCASHRINRALESVEASTIRRESNCASHRIKRALETVEACVI